MKAEYITLISILLIVIAGIAAYVNSLEGQFVWDDMSLIRENTAIKSRAHLTRIFTQNLRRAGAKEELFYRPLEMSSYMLNYALWKYRVRGFHLTNVILHILVALSVYALARILSDDYLLSFLAGILFVVHPVHTEAVAYISGRADPLAALFMLLCFLLYLKNLSGPHVYGYILTPACYLLALLSKEYSLILPLLLLFYHYAFKKKIRLGLYLPLLALAPGYLILRATVFSSFLVSASLPASTLWQRMPGFPAAIFDYLRLLILPLHLHMEYGIRLFTFSHPRVIAGLIALFLLLYCGIKKRSSPRIVFFSLGWFFLALLPVSNLYPLNAYLAEHWLYFPSIGIFLLAAKGLASLLRNRTWRPVGFVLTIGALGFFLVRTVQQNRYWRDAVDFYQRTLTYAPASARLHNNLGLVYEVRGRLEEAIQEYRNAVELDPGYARAYNNLGCAYAQKGMAEEAVKTFQEAINIEPDYARPYNNLGLAYQEKGALEEATRLFQKAVELDPDYVKAHNNLGLAYQNQGRFDEAVSEFRVALRIDPDDADLHHNLGTVCARKGDYAAALKHLKKALALNPDMPETRENLEQLRRLGIW